MPRSSLPLLLVGLAACGPSPTQSLPGRMPSTRATPAQPTASRCSFVVQRVSAPGRGAMRPQIAAAGDAFAVAWEETTDHRAVRVQTFTADAQPLGPSLEVADSARPGAEPRVVGLSGEAGFAVFWSAEQGDTSVIDLRRVDRNGRPRSLNGDVVPVVVAPGARPLAAGLAEGGFAVAWWNWSGTPHQLAVSFVDKEGHPLGRAVAVTRTPSPDPTVDVAPGASVGARGAEVIAWEELVDSVEHVVVSEVGQRPAHPVEGRVDLGPGETPELGGGVVVFERAREQGIFTAALDGRTVTRVGDGHVPSAAARGPNRSALCFLRDTDPSQEAHVDELICGDLVGANLVDATRVAIAPRGIFAVQVAALGDRIGVTWQSQEDDDTAVSFASLSCPAPAAARARR